MDNQTKKAEYESPEVVTHGSFEEITAGGSDGFFTDAAFPTHTPFTSLTFS